MQTIEQLEADITRRLEELDAALALLHAGLDEIEALADTTKGEKQ